MRKIFAVILTVSMLIGVSGCSTETNLQNLDLSETVIIENTPENGVWENLKYNRDETISPQTKDTVQKIVNGFFPELAFDEKNVVIRTSKDDIGCNIAYASAEEEDYLNATQMRYIGDEIYLELAGSNMFEMYNRKTVLDSIGKEWTGKAMWRPYFSGTVKKESKITSETDLSETYPLCGNEVSIAEALDFAQKTMESGTIPYICAEGCKTQPINVEIFKFDETHYGYNFKFQLTYNNVPIDASKAAGYSNEDLTDIKGYICQTYIELFTFTGDTIDWIWTTPLSGECVEKEECDKLITYEEACAILSKELSPDFVFDVESAELNYSLKIVRQGENSGNYIIPTWRFRVIDLSGFNDFSVLYIYINAETKDLYTEYAA